jgi:hypothetical protein
MPCYTAAKSARAAHRQHTTKATPTPALCRLAAEAGAQQDTATFAAWEDAGRGIASKLMAKMGFTRGKGLGKTGAGVSVCVRARAGACVWR